MPGPLALSKDTPLRERTAGDPEEETEGAVPRGGDGCSPPGCAHSFHSAKMAFQLVLVAGVAVSGGRGG